MSSPSSSSPLPRGPALYLVREPEPPFVRLEARASAHQRVVFVHGERTYVLGAVSELATVELYGVGGVHVVLCVDRGAGPARLATARIRIWSSRDGGASWSVDPSFDVGSLEARTRLMRLDPAR